MPKSADADIDRRVKIIDGENKSGRPIERVSDLRALPFVVLLGEPGIGKSTVLAKEAANEGVPVVSVRELMTGTEAPPGACLFLDALDEY
jgi:putative ribosome biogenesis GTPase RsgA